MGGKDIARPCYSQPATIHFVLSRADDLGVFLWALADLRVAARGLRYRHDVEFEKRAVGVTDLSRYTFPGGRRRGDCSGSLCQEYSASPGGTGRAAFAGKHGA